MTNLPFSLTPDEPQEESYLEKMRRVYDQGELAKIPAEQKTSGDLLGEMRLTYQETKPREFVGPVKPKQTPEEWFKQGTSGLVDPYKEFFKGADIGKAFSNLKRQIPEFIAGIPGTVKALTPFLRLQQPPISAPSVMAPKGEGRYITAVKTAADMAIWLPKTIYGLAKSPSTFLEENPLDVMFLMGGHATGKGVTRIKNKIKAKKAIVAADLELLASESKQLLKDAGRYQKKLESMVPFSGRHTGTFAEQLRVQQAQGMPKPPKTVKQGVTLPKPKKTIKPPEKLVPKEKVTERRRWAREEIKEADISKLKPEELVKRKEYLGRLAKEYGEDLTRMDEFMKDVPDVGTPPVKARKPFVKGDITSKIRAFKSEIQTIDKLVKPKEVTTIEYKVGDLLGEGKHKIVGITEMGEFKIENIRSGAVSTHPESRLAGLFKQKVDKPSFLDKEMAKTESIREQLKKIKSKDKDITELHAGYPLGKEFKESLKRIKGVALPSFKESQDIYEYKPSKPLKTIKPKEAPSVEPYTTPTKGKPEVIHVKKQGEMPVMKHEMESLTRDGVRDMRQGKFKAEYETAIRIWEDYPSVKKAIYDTWNESRKREWVKKRDVSAKGGVIYKWKEDLWKSKVNPKQATRRLGIYATAQQKHGKGKLTEAGIKIPELTPSEMKIYKDGRVRFDEYFTKINEARKLSGQKPLEHVDNYYTWLTNWNKLTESGINIIMDEGKIISGHLGGIPLKYATPRKGGKVPVHLDYFKVFEKYSHDVIHAIEMTPIIAKGRAMLEPMTFPSATGSIEWSVAQNTPRFAGYMEHWLDRIAGKKFNAASPFFARVAGKLNKNIGMAILSMNARSALIQPSALRNSYIALGEYYTVRGLLDNLNPAKRKMATDISNVLGPRNMDIHLVKLLDEGIGGKISRAKQKVGEAGIKYGLQFLDQETARATWLGAYEKALKVEKLTGNPRRVYADDVVTKSQASGAIGDISKVQSTPVGKFFTLFQTFVINEWGLITKDVLGMRNPGKPVGKKLLDVTRLVIGTALVNAYYEGILKIRSPYPAPEWAIKHGVESGKEGRDIAGDVMKEMLEQIPVVGGAIRWSQPYRQINPSASMQTIVEGMGVLNKLITFKPERINAYDLATVGKLIGVPGTSQIMKYISRRRRGMNHAQSILGVRVETAPKKKKYPKIY